MSRNRQSQWVPVPVPEFRNHYEINRAGDVRSIKTGQLLAKGRPNTNSPFVILASKEVIGGRKAYTVSKLVKMTFTEPRPRSRNRGAVVSTHKISERGLSALAERRTLNTE